MKVLKYLKRFEEVEFSTENEIDPGIPGFATGGYDPDDPDENEIVKQIYKATYERNFIDNGDFIEVNMSRLYDDFYNHIYDENGDEHYKKFVRDKLIGKYICKGVANVMDENENPEGIIEKLGFAKYGDDDRYHRVLVMPKFKGKPKSENLVMQDNITIDKIKSNSEKFGI